MNILAVNRFTQRKPIVAEVLPLHIMTLFIADSDKLAPFWKHFAEQKSLLRTFMGTKIDFKK